MRRNRWAALVVAAALCGCTAPDGPLPVVEVRAESDTEWRAAWTFPAPVDGLRFERSASFSRERGWRVVTPGYALGRAGGVQVVTRARGAAPTAVVEIAFPVDTRDIPREHAAFLRFTDGSVALYTGMFHAASLDGAQSVDQVRIDSGGQPLVQPGAGADGTYAYIGGIAPLHAAHITAIVDPGLPAWLAYEAEQRFATFFAALAVRTGHPLPQRPLVLFNFEPGAVDGYAYRGGALQGVIHLTAVGDGWHDADPGAVRAVLRFIAHEATHMWNAGLVRFRPGTPPWLYEGVADALAERLLVEAGIVPASALAASAAAALDECARLSGEPLNTTRVERAHYACGALAALWSERLLQAADPRRDLFDLIGALVTHARADDGRYGADEWFAALTALGADPAGVAELQAFVGTPHADPHAAWRDALQALE